MLAGALVLAGLTIAGSQGDGYFVPRFGYSTRITPVTLNVVRTGSLAFDTRRFSLSGEGMQGSSSHTALALSVTGRVTPGKIWIFRPGLGGWYTQSQYTQVLFTGEKWSIDNRGQSRMIAGVVDLGVGVTDGSPFHIRIPLIKVDVRGRGMVRVAGIMGRAESTETLDLVVDGRITDSPITSRIQEHSSFQAVRVSTRLAFGRFSLDSSATGVHPVTPSYATPGGFGIFSGKVAYTSPWHVGLFVQKTLVRGMPAIGVQSIQPFYDGLRFGLSVRIP